MNNNNKLPFKTIRSSQFNNRLSLNSNENLQLISLIENYLTKKRGDIFKMPSPKKPVILIASGGLDSTIIWEILLQTYHLKVYPLFLNRHVKKSHHEQKSVHFFSHYFQKKYPELSQPVKEIFAPIPPTEINPESSKDITKTISPANILNGLDPKTGIFTPPAPTQLTFTYPLYGMAYADFLNNQKNLNINTIFTAVLPDDGTVVSPQTFTSLKTTLLTMCATSGNYNWQLCSLPFEKEMGHWFTKPELIKYAEKHLHLPMEKTWSCYQNYKNHCGDQCIACKNRRYSFHQAKATDKTIYQSDLVSLNRKIKRKLKHLLTRIFKLPILKPVISLIEKNARIHQARR